MNVLVAKNLKKQIEDFPLKSVRVFNDMMKSMSSGSFDFSSSRSIQIQQTEVQEFRASDLDVFYYLKDDSIFIIQVRRIVQAYEAYAPVQQ